MVATAEAELVQRVREGDKAAFQQLLGQHLGPVTQFAFRLTGDASLAEDVAQEVFLRLWSRAGQFDPSRSKLTTWLHNIARNLCIDHFRKQGRQISDDEQINAAESGSDPVLETGDSDIMKSLLKLPETQRSAVLLCYYQGFSNLEAAEMLGIKVVALESLLARARRKLRIELAEMRSP